MNINKMTRLTALTLCIALSAATFAGCSAAAGTASAAEPYPEKNAESSLADVYYPSADSQEWTAGAAEEDGYDGYKQSVDINGFGNPEMNNEGYAKVTEVGFRETANNPFSTFSADVDTASYANVRRMINDNGGVDPDAVRIEEFINYFNYEYPEPTGSDPISVNTELSACPWNENAMLMLVGIKAKELEQKERPPMNLVLLIDVSGSMYDEDKLPLVQQSMLMLAETLGTKDRISIVTYAGSEKIVLKGAEGTEYGKIEKAVNSLEAGGSTYGEAGINAAYSLAEKYFIKGGNNRIILATDGDLNVGISDTEQLKDLISKKKESGIFLSVLGFGTGNIKDDKMEALADNGNGNFNYIDKLDEAYKVLVAEMSGTLYTVAKDVKIQVEFNPANVQSYRLVGYDNRRLKNQDFENDAKDAGDMGAGHTVTALYEIIPTETIPQGKYSNPDAEETKNALDKELLTVSLRYKQPDSDESSLIEKPVLVKSMETEPPQNLSFAASAAEFAMLLKNSEFKGTSSFSEIKDLSGYWNAANDTYRSEFMQLVEKAHKQEII